MEPDRILEAVARRVDRRTPASCACGRDLAVSRVSLAPAAWLVSCRPCGAHGVYLAPPGPALRPLRAPAPPT